MLSEVQYKMVLKFFLFLIPDEERALAISAKAVRQIHLRQKKDPAKNLELLMLRIIGEIYLKYHQQFLKPSAKKSKGPWQPLQNDRALAWRKYLSDSEPEVRVILVMRYILGFSADAIAHATDLTLGTVLYRVGRGLESVSEKMASS